MESNSEAVPEAQGTKTSGWKRLLYIILIVVPIITLLEFGIGMMFAIRGLPILVQQRLLEQRNQVAGLAMNLLVNAILAPGERLQQMQFKDIGADIALLVQDYPEITEVYRIEGKGKATTYFTKLQEEKIHQEISEIAPTAIDTIRFNNCLWDTTCKFGWHWLDIQDRRFLLFYFKTAMGDFLVVRDIEELKTHLPAILDGCQRRLAVFADYFLPFPPIGAQLKFYDQNGNNFCTYGNPRGKGWDDILEQKASFLPWKMTVQIFSEQSELFDVAALKNRFPWKGIIQIVIGVACIIVLARSSRRYWWGGNGN